jgi:hypothetical protein
LSTTTTNYGFVKPALTDPANIEATNPNWDLIDEKLKSLDGKSASEVVKTITVLPEMWVGTEFPCTCTVAHNLGGEPSTKPLVDLNVSSYTTVDEIDEAESAYNLLYKVTFDETHMVLYSKEVPKIGYSVIVKVVM